MNVKDEIERGTALVRSMPAVTGFALIGSASYLPEQAQDVDFAVMLADGQHAVDYCVALEPQGFTPCGQYDGVGGIWYAVRHGHVNLIVTHDRKFYDGYLLAMEVCKVLRLANKEDRIAVCQVVRDGMTADAVRPPLPESWEEFV